MSAGLGFENMFPMCELVLNDTAIVPDQELTDPKPELENSVPHYECKEKNIHFVNKLFFCLHIKLRKNELTMEINNKILFITVSANAVFRFSHWEYEFANETLKLCMEDYLKIYEALPPNGFIDNEAASVEFSETFMIISLFHCLLHFFY